jgi:3D (Asp-Asp-Asp) domain-containing protein
MKRSVAIIAMFVCATGLLASAGSRVESPPAGDGELMQTAAVATTPPRVTRRQIWMEVTAYCACTRCCGPNARGVTASGLPVTHNLGRFAAADSSVLPLGSRIHVPGYHEGQSIPVIDRGGAIKGNKLDVFFPTHEQALKWGRRWLLVTVETPEQGWADPV